MGSYAVNSTGPYLAPLKYCKNISDELINDLLNLVYDSQQQKRFSKPMPLIGMYIALASLLCVVALIADLIHGWRNKIHWFPCKYCSLNAASLTIIAVATKLPMDLNDPMPGEEDHLAKIGSMAFMCTMMANSLPSLATMNNKELASNVIALGILVITLVVNVCIQIETSVISNKINIEVVSYTLPIIFTNSSKAILYIAMLLILLMIHICSALMILTSKQILELKYNAAHEKALENQNQQQSESSSTVERLKQQVSNYWIIAGTGSPQFMAVCSATTLASGTICFISTSFHVYYYWLTNGISKKDHHSDYKWSVSVIHVIQTAGVFFGQFVPLARRNAIFSFKWSKIWVWNTMNVFKVERYWTQKLSDWKHTSILFSSNRLSFMILFQNLQVLIFNLLIPCQKAIVVACKIIGIIFSLYTFFWVFIFLCLAWFKSKLVAFGILSVRMPTPKQQDTSIRQYVVQLQDDVELADMTVKSILKSVNHLITKSEKQAPKNLTKLLEICTGYEGIGKFVSDHVQLGVFTEEPVNCWSLPLVTLTAIAVSLPDIAIPPPETAVPPPETAVRPLDIAVPLPDIRRKIYNSLLSGVNEGLVYVTHVEKSLNATNEYVCSQKDSKILWREVVSHKWLGKKLKNHPPEVITAKQILKWLCDTAEPMVKKLESTDFGGSNDKSNHMSICANLMYRITKTILLSYEDNPDEVSHMQLFEQLASMIADILAACLNNLPRVIEMTCHTNVIEKREASVHAAARLLGQTMQIINNLPDRGLPDLSADDLPFIDKWRAKLSPPNP